jgi:Holliday junction resolvasome RuvABC endonuclease subunit
MSILALDLGTRTGWAYAATTGTIISGVWDFKPGKFDGGGMRFLRFKDTLERFYREFPLKAIYYEGVRAHRGVDAAHVYGGLMATLQTFCEIGGVPCDAVGVGEIKRFWTGKGNAPKEAMIAEAIRRGFTVEDDNQADALALLHLKLEGG